MIPTIFGLPSFLIFTDDIVIYVLIIVTYLFSSLGGISGLLFGVSFSKHQIEQHPFLKKLPKKTLFVATCVFVFIAAVSGVSKEILSTKSSLELIQGPGGELTQKATYTGFKKELEEAMSECINEAEDYFNAAERDFSASRYQEAAINYQKSINVFPTMSCYLNLGRSLFYTAEFQKAEVAFDSGIQIAQKKGNKEFERAFLGNIGNIYSKQGEQEKALESYFAVLELSSNLHDKGHTLGNIGVVYFRQGKLEDALQFQKDALEISEKLGCLLGQASSYLNIGNIFYVQEKLDEALETYKKALKLTTDKTIDQANIINNIGVIYTDRGNFEEALALFWSALKFYKQVCNPQGQAMVINNIGEVYFNKGTLEESIKFYEESLNLFKQVGDPSGQADSINNIGKVYFRQGKLDKGLESYNSACKLYEQIGDPIGKAKVIIGISNIYFNQGREREALELLKHVRDIYLKMDLKNKNLQAVEETLKQHDVTMVHHK